MILARVARFFLVHNTKTGRNVQNEPNGHKISQTSLKYSKWQKNISTFSNLRPSEIYPNFWFENKPSGNPDPQRSGKPRTYLMLAIYLGILPRQQ
jgi:hypothetical protein